MKSILEWKNSAEVKKKHCSKPSHSLLLFDSFKEKMIKIDENKQCRLICSMEECFSLLFKQLQLQFTTKYYQHLTFITLKPVDMNLPYFYGFLLKMILRSDSQRGVTALLTPVEVTTQSHLNQKLKLWNNTHQMYCSMNFLLWLQC